MEDFVTWVNASAIRKHVMEYNATVTYLIFSFPNTFLFLAPKVKPQVFAQVLYMF